MMAPHDEDTRLSLLYCHNVLIAPIQLERPDLAENKFINIIDDATNMCD